MKKVLVAMSGGVDSSVATYLLKNEGYQVVGATMKLWHSDESAKKKGGCCSIEDVSDARRVAHHLGIRHYVFNFEQMFKDTVVQNFADEYFSGRTPNPCIVCNEIIKFNLLLHKAISLGFDYLATGHYARIEKQRTDDRKREADVECSGGIAIPQKCSTEEIFVLKKGIDEKKDQSYFLYRLTQNQLSRLLFPVGELTKEDVRKIAVREKLPVARKKESYDVCFVDDGDYRSFLSRQKAKNILTTENTKNTEKKKDLGFFVDINGNKLGKHKGLGFYTIGQRSGLFISSTEKLYVLKLNREKNEVVVGPKEKCFSKKFTLQDVVWTSYKPKLPRSSLVKIRYLNKEEPAEIYDNKNPLYSPFVKEPAPHLIREVSRLCRDGVFQRGIVVEFIKPQFAVTPGQAAVFYDGEIVIGGGVIDAAEPSG